MSHIAERHSLWHLWLALPGAVGVVGEWMADAGPAEPRYKAFLSYSHEDALLAAKLHHRLESYRLPRRLVGRETRRGPVPDRLWPIFRDREELSASVDLSEAVRAGLEQSAALVVLCSPAAARSLWVPKEIEAFRALHPDRPVLAAIIAGDPPGCFPETMLARRADGAWHEPLATDLRREGDGPQLGLLKLVAGLTGIGLDDLVQRDAQRRIRRVTAVTGIALAAMLIMAALTVFALGARREAERQRAEAEGMIEFMLTDLRDKLRGVGRLDVMTAANDRALSYYGDQQDLDALPPDSLQRRARILHAMGEDDLARRRPAAARAAFDEAFRTTEALLTSAPDDPARLYAHAQSEFWLGRMDYDGRRYPEARTRFQRYKHLADRLVAIDGGNADWLKEAAYAEGNLCTIALAAPDGTAPEEAVRSCTSALERMEQVRGAAGDDAALAADLVNRHAWAADAWQRAGRWDRVHHHRLRQEELARDLIRRDARNLDYRDIWMRTQFAHAELLRSRGRTADALPRYREAAAAAAALVAADPANEDWIRWRARTASAASVFAD